MASKNLTFDGYVLNVGSYTGSTGTSTGAIVVKGGVGVQDSIYAGNTVTGKILRVNNRTLGNGNTIFKVIDSQTTDNTITLSDKSGINALLSDIPVSAVANGVDNRLVTFSSADALNGEANLTFDGSTLTVTGTVNATTVNATTLQIGGTSILATATELNILDGVTATASELNILDGATLSVSELNILDGVTASTSEINQLDGITVVSTTGSQTLTNKTLTSPTISGLNLSDSSIVFEGSLADDFETTLTVTNPTADRTLTLPNATDTIVGRATTDTLTNKTIDADNNTISNLAHGSEVDNPTSGVHGVTGSVVGTSDSQTLTNKTIDADNNTISNLAHGSEVDNPSSGVHGVTGNVVGTSDTQTLTNKTLTTPIIAEIDNTSNITLDAGADIVLNADGGDVFFKDAGITYGSMTNTSGDLIIKSGTTTALTFSGSSVTIAGDATIGGDDINSSSFSSGFSGSGWKIDNASHLEVESATIRGTLSVYELLIQQIRATNGAVFISSAAKVESTSGLSASDDNGTITFEDASGNNLCPFSDGDIIMMERINPGALVASNAAGDATDVIKKLVYEVTGVTNNTATVTNAGFENLDFPSAGDEFVRIGNNGDTANRDGIIYLTSDDSNAPFIDIKASINSYSEWTTSMPKVRLGKLSGITDADINGGSELSGFGLYSDNIYLKGEIVATSGKIGGITIASSKVYTGTGTHNNSNTGFYIDSSSNFSLGDKFSWNGSALTIDGTVTIGSNTASNLITGSDVNANVTSISGGVITTGTLDASVVNVTNLSATNINTGTLDASGITVTNLDASSVNAGTMSADRILLGGLDLTTYVDNSLFGDGSDGSSTISGNTTLTSDKYYSSLTIDAGVTLNTGGYRVFVSGTLTMGASAKIANNGTNANNGGFGFGGSGGSGGASGTLRGGADGGAGGGTQGAGVAGGSADPCINANDGAAGGTGEGVGGGDPGSGGTAGSASVKKTNFEHIDPTILITMRDIYGIDDTPKTIRPSCAGGGGGGGGTKATTLEDGHGGGGGGGGGGTVLVCAKTISLGTGSKFESKGGNGGNGYSGTSGDGGGGGAGNGGAVVVLSNTSVSSSYVDVTPGSAGTSVGGSDGGAGSSGTFIMRQI